MVGQELSNIGTTLNVEAINPIQSKLILSFEISNSL